QALGRTPADPDAVEIPEKVEQDGASVRRDVEAHPGPLFGGELHPAGVLGDGVDVELRLLLRLPLLFFGLLFGGGETGTGSPGDQEEQEQQQADAVVLWTQ